MPSLPPLLLFFYFDSLLSFLLPGRKAKFGVSCFLLVFAFILRVIYGYDATLVLKIKTTTKKEIRAFSQLCVFFYSISAAWGGKFVLFVGLFGYC